MKDVPWLVLFLFLLVSCDGGSLNASKNNLGASGGLDFTGVSSDGVGQQFLIERAGFIKKQIEKNKEWGGGHSIIPRKIVNANTFSKVFREISIKDDTALMILLQDDASDIRIAATVLFECVDPAVKDKITEQRNKESDVLKKDRLGDALLLIDVMRAGGTTCK